MINYSDLYKCSIKHLIKLEYLTGHFDIVAFMSMSRQGKWKLALTARSVVFFMAHDNVINITVLKNDKKQNMHDCEHVAYSSCCVTDSLLSPADNSRIVLLPSSYPSLLSLFQFAQLLQ